MSQQIGETIVQQIRALDKFAFAAWGAKDFVYMNDGLKFKTSGMVRRKCYVYIRYNSGLDLYEIIYGRIRKFEWIVDDTIPMVFADGLVEHINHYVG